ncbi:STAS domain-containing protein [Streptomyces sp. NPDC051217]|uniref:STAS domain-containing protein n=1 Tax=Streptomyces sp. NPDC051217 TaxID=3365644 RepID=UPI003798A28A
MTAHAFESRIAVRTGVARVTLVGELDLDTAPHVREAVAACLAKRPKSLCLDLTSVGFCDCAGLNALLAARISVLEAGAALVVEGIGPQLARLLTLVGADDILTDERVRQARRRRAPAEAGRPLPTGPARPPLT